MAKKNAEQNVFDEEKASDPVAEESKEVEEVAEGAADEASENVQESDEEVKDGAKSKTEEKIEELNDRLIRNMAEFENFRNRSEKEKTAMFEIGAKSVIEKVLPVVDNFERGIGAMSEDDRDSAFGQGMEAIYKQLMTSLEEIGVTPIEAVGKEFDPEYHNAVMHDEDDSLGQNIVSEELQKGYMYKESVVRHSMVKVVN